MIGNLFAYIQNEAGLAASGRLEDSVIRPFFKRAGLWPAVVPVV